MVNPLLAFGLARRRPTRPRNTVPIPREVASSGAIFLVLRRMRMPLLFLVAVFTIAVAGLAATPGIGPDGQPRRLTVFESFYVMSYTATTIGFGEIPQAFTTAQRLWVTAMIYATVVGWAWAVGSMLSLAQDEGFTHALAMQRVGRTVRRVRQPFHIVAGYGEAGRSVCRRLDALGMPFVVIDEQRSRVDMLESSELTFDIASVTGDVADPAVLGLAGLGHDDCAGVLALTDDDDANLAVVQTVAMLQPDVPVIARVADRTIEDRMHDFGPQAVINPVDRFGNYLVLALQRPAVHQLVVWLTSPRGGDLPSRREPHPRGRWTVFAEGPFRDEVCRDLDAAGYDVRLRDPAEGDPDVTGSAGCVVATLRDSENLAVAARIRRDHPDVLLCVRQVHIASRPLIAAFGPDIVFVPTDIVARESLARIIAPRTWAFIEHAMERDDVWAAGVVDHLRERCGRRSPTPSLLTLDARSAPAVTTWLADHELLVGDLVRDPEDRERHIAATVLTLTRGEEVVQLPDPATPLRAGDELLLMASGNARGLLREVLFNDAGVEYVATGRRVPQTWIWRRLSRA